MAEASRTLAYERAARIRDQIGHLKSFARAQKVEDTRFYDVDVIGIHQDGEGLTEVAVLFFREGKLLSSRPYTFDIRIDAVDLLGQFLLRFYDGKRYIPERVYIPLRIPDLEGVEGYLADLRKAPFSLKVGKRGEEAKLIQLARENARLSLKASRKTQEGAARIAESLRERLSLKRTPVSIEGVDISTTGGGEAVGAVVHFKNGEAMKSRFRRYRIKTVKGMDDYAMLREVVARRLRRGLKEKDFPDLLLVDGGVGQLNCALEAARDLEVSSMDFLGIRKGETRAKGVQVREGSDDRIVTPEEGVSECIRPGSPEMHLLQRIRDEAHRFAIAYHRKRRSKAGLSSPLDGIKGLGAAGKKRLLAHFGGLQGLRGASRGEIQRVKGVGAVLAGRIHEALHD
jgi:excinuclease ABC subunit C